MAYTEKTETGLGSRLGGSLRGICFGFLLVATGTGLLWWNEGNFVKSGDALTEAQGATQSLGDINTVNAGLNGKLVHATGLATTKDILTDPVFNVATKAIRLERSVEFFQWTESSKTETQKKADGKEEKVTTYTYSQGWSKSPVDSSAFHAPDARQNKVNTVIMPLENHSIQAQDVALGAYRLPAFLVNSISGQTNVAVTIPTETLEALNKQLAPPAEFTPYWQQEQTSWQPDKNPAASPVSMVHTSGSTVYLGISPAAPNVGDVRVTFKEVRPTTVSIMAKLNGDTFEQFIASNGKSVSMLRMGEHSQENMYGSAHSSNETMTWILRAVGVLVVILGVRMVLAPIAVVADVVPLLGNIVGAGVGLVAGLVGLAWSLLVVAVAWLRFRPLVGGIMVGVAVALIALAVIRGQTAKK